MLSFRHPQASEKGKDDRAAILNQAQSSLAQVRAERRKGDFRA